MGGLSLFAVAFLSAPSRSSRIKQPPGLDWFWPVAISTKSDPQMQIAAKRLAKILSGSETLWVTEQNPVCCLWLNVGPGNPPPSEPGYVIFLQALGGRIVASDSQQLNLAIDHLERVRKAEGRRVRLPWGILTSFHVTESAEDSRHGEYCRQAAF
jgi:hypothetical protein